MDNKNISFLKTSSAIITISLSSAGLLAVALGSLLGEPWKDLLISIGAAIVGVIIGFAITRISSFEKFSEINIVKEAQIPGFNSDESKVSTFRKEWHIYHQTEKMGHTLWRHSKGDLREYYQFGKLKGKWYEVDPDNSEVRPMDVVAGLWGDIFILFLEPNDSECKQIMLFPFLGKTFVKTQGGLAIFETYDKNRYVGPCIISSKNIIKSNKLGTVDNKYVVELIKEWELTFKEKLGLSWNI
jgi:hypothetical protein